MGTTSPSPAPPSNVMRLGCGCASVAAPQAEQTFDAHKALCGLLRQSPGCLHDLAQRVQHALPKSWFSRQQRRNVRDGALFVEPQKQKLVSDDFLELLQADLLARRVRLAQCP